MGFRYGLQVAIKTQIKLRSVRARVDSRAKRSLDKQVVGDGAKHANRGVASARGVCTVFPCRVGDRTWAKRAVA